ncbi:hypothetical protein K474DRAFT_1667190 [Panus rudis PR-1116 ss-1]|nr:hypothetical protein K474DRAFT_1667190 [Panus rudis PR-1116 ss-1]
MVIGTPQSPRHGTFVPVHSPAPRPPMHVAYLPERPTSARSPTPGAEKAEVEIVEVVEVSILPQNIPLPDSPGIVTPAELEPIVDSGAEDGEAEDDGPRPVRGERPLSDVSEKVARWLQSTPTGSSFSSPATSPEPTSPPSPTKSKSSVTKSDAAPLPAIQEDQTPPSSAQSTVKDRKEKPAPISISATAIAVSAQPASLPSIFAPLQSPTPEHDDPRSPRQASTPKLSISPPVVSRGRSQTVSPDNKHGTGLSLNTSTSRSNVPALSPTRTTSSSGASEVPPTPTTTSHRGRHTSIVSSISSSDNHAQQRLPRLKVSTAKEDLEPVATVIVESPVEEANEGPSPVPTPRPRPPRQATDSPITQERRKSLTFGLFGSKANALGGNERPSKLASPTRSMTNLRRSVAGTISAKLRPKSTLVVDTSVSSSASVTSHSSSSITSRRQMPSPSSSARSPLSPPSSYRPVQGDSLGALPRPRQRTPLSPTMHSRGSILMETKGIEDDESRRLAELAFLDF